MKKFSKINSVLFVVAIYIVSIPIKAQPIVGDSVQSIQPVILVSDLMRPFDDPDDHWDLATAFALAYSGAIDLKGMIIDSPENEAYIENKNPDVAAVAMLNYITGLHVPVVTGSPHPLKNKFDKQEYALVKDMGGVHLIHDILSESEVKVKIVITGSSRDVAIALNRFPRLFEEKCGGIYINAGFANDDNPYERSRPEWNTKLDIQAYHAIFLANCPIYWLPCNVSHYVLLHSDIIPQLSLNMKKFFTFMYEKRPAENWYQYLQKPLDGALLNSINDKYRSMFCTIGFLHATGFNNSSHGKVPTLLPEFDWQLFEPVQISKDAENGYMPYSLSEKSNIFLLRVDEDKTVYKEKTSRALANLLKWLP